MFVRAPRVGTLKRRLAAEVGAGAAWRFYRRTTRRLLRRLARDPRWTCWLAVAPDSFSGHEPFWLARCPVLRQGRGDLGARMARVFAALPPGPAVIVGTDIPALATQHAARAFAALERADVVFGPAADGGYWLVGLARRRPLPDPFADVAWSTPHALADTLANLPKGLRVVLVDTLEDVDDRADYDRWRAYVERLGAPPDARVQASAMHSISTSNSIGQDAMATKVRAGGSCGK